MEDFVQDEPTRVSTPAVAVLVAQWDDDRAQSTYRLVRKEVDGRRDYNLERKDLDALGAVRWVNVGPDLLVMLGGIEAIAASAAKLASDARAAIDANVLTGTRN